MNHAAFIISAYAITLTAVGAALIGAWLRMRRAEATPGGRTGETLSGRAEARPSDPAARRD